MISKNWKYKAPSPELVNEIAKECKLSVPAAAVLVNRGINSAAQAREFLYPDFAGLENPFLLPDIDPAVKRIRKALEKKEKILVYGDRDTDGVTSISIMVRTLKSLGAEPLWYIPSDEGYGVHKEIIDRYAAQGVSLMITVDCGISAVEETVYARSKGIDTVVTDHHEPNIAGIPEAVAVVDPKRQDSKYPFSELAGCSVSLKVAEALMLSFGKNYDKELVSFGLKEKDGAFDLSAVKIKNGIVLDTFSTNSSGRESLKRFMFFIGRAGIIVYKNENALSFIKGLIVQHLAIEPDNRTIDLAGAFLSHFPEHTPEDIPSLAGMGNNTGLTALDDALYISRMFRRLEDLTDLRMKFFRDSHLDAVALGTIADIVPLVRENRILVSHGLKALARPHSVGIRALLEDSGKLKNGGLSAKSISWGITPLINAAGRRGRADLAAELFLTDDEQRAWKLIADINKLNTERRELQAENMDKFLPLLKEQCDIENDKVFMVTATGIEHGVTGIIASQIMRTYHRPTLLLIIEGDEAMGAARSVPGYDITRLFGKVSDILIKYGGHSQAAGMTVAVNKLEELRRRIREIAAKDLPPELLVPSLDIDSEIDSSEVTMSLVKELSGFEPCGMGNPLPVFSLRNMKVLESATVGSRSDHLKLKIGNNGKALSAVGWGMGHLQKEIQSYPSLDFAVQLELNVWQDRKSVQVLILDIKPNG